MIYLIKFSGQDSRVERVEATIVSVECAETNQAYFTLSDEDGNVKAAIPFNNVRAIVAETSDPTKAGTE